MLDFPIFRNKVDEQKLFQILRQKTAYGGTLRHHHSVSVTEMCKYCIAPMGRNDKSPSLAIDLLHLRPRRNYSSRTVFAFSCDRWVRCSLGYTYRGRVSLRATYFMLCSWVKHDPPPPSTTSQNNNEAIPRHRKSFTIRLTVQTQHCDVTARWRNRIPIAMLSIL